MSPQGLLILIFVAIVVVSVGWAQKNSPKDGVTAELLRATKGDRSLAQRLLQQVRYKHPGKSAHWYVEKVLYDLQRDGAGGASSARDFRIKQIQRHDRQGQNPIAAFFRGIGDWMKGKR
ncbi:MAG: hypothetical protein ACOYME_10205 [Prochlorotrichaceae cyanobacterium]|jgi:hypothetical protein